MRRIGQVGKMGLFKRIIGSEVTQVMKEPYGQAKQGASKLLTSTVRKEFGDDDEGEPMPAPTKAEVLDAIEGMYDVLRSCPRSYGVEAALAGLAECTGELAEGVGTLLGEGDNFDDVNEAAIDDKTRRQLHKKYLLTREKFTPGVSASRLRKIEARRSRLPDSEDEAAEGLVHIGNVGDLDWGLSDPFRGESDEYDPYYGNQFHPGYDADDQFGSNYAPRRRGR